MPQSMHVVCPHCDSINRIPAERLVEQPLCGRCHKLIFIQQPLQLNEERFILHLSRNAIPVLVDFWAAWCAPCLMMAPVFEQAAQSLEPRLRLIKINTEENPEIAIRYGIRSIPTLILFHHERELARSSGALDLARLLAWTQTYLK